MNKKLLFIPLLAVLAIGLPVSFGVQGGVPQALDEIAIQFDGINQFLIDLDNRLISLESITVVNGTDGAQGIQGESGTSGLFYQVQANATIPANSLPAVAVAVATVHCNLGDLATLKVEATINDAAFLVLPPERIRESSTGEPLQGGWRAVITPLIPSQDGTLALKTICMTVPPFAP